MTILSSKIIRRLILCFLVLPGHSYVSAAERGSDFELVKIAEGIYLHPGRHEDLSATNAGDIANIGFIVGNSSVMVVDPGGSFLVGARLKKAISSVTSLPISHVVYTHVHPDHIYGASAFQEVKDFVAHNKFQLGFAQRDGFYRERLDYLFDDASGATQSSEIPAATLVIEKDLAIDLGGRMVQIRAHEVAHTDNDLTVFDERTQTLWASDLVFTERTPSLDGSLVGWLRVLDELEALAPALVVPGHGEPGNWRQLVEPQREYLDTLLKEIRTYIANGSRLSDALKEVMVENAGQWQLYDLHHPSNITKAFTELEWE